jgi:hypothetical protein
LQIDCSLIPYLEPQFGRLDMPFRGIGFSRAQCFLAYNGYIENAQKIKIEKAIVEVFHNGIYTVLKIVNYTNAMHQLAFVHQAVEQSLL